MESRGNYLPLIELKVKGYLPPEFPDQNALEFVLVEHVIGPTGYIVEMKPGTEENTIYNVQSLWADQTGQVRLGTRDGPRFER